MKENLKEKLNLVGKLLVVGWIIQLALFTTGGNFNIKNLWITVVTMGPVAGSCLLAIAVSEILDKRRNKNVQEYEERNERD